MSTPELTAREIAEELLDRSGEGMMSGDFRLFSSCFSLPTQMETFDGRRVLETLDEMERVFNDVRAYYSKIGATRVVRHIVDAEFRNATSIVSTHNASVYVGEELVQQPFDVLSVLESKDGEWRIRHSEYLITDAPDHKDALIGPGAKLEEPD